MKGKNKTIKGYKAFNKDLKCRDFQFEENKEYSISGKPVLREKGFHFCTNPFDVLNYYDLLDSEFTEVDAVGETTRSKDNCSKQATSKIKIGVKLGLSGFIKASVDFLVEHCKTTVKKNNDSDYAQIGSSGYYAQIGSSGYSAQIGSSGYSAQIGSSGNSAQIGSSGDYAQIGSSGYYAKIELNGEDSVGVSAGVNAVIKGKKNNWITLSEWEYDNNKSRYIPVCVKSAQIDGKKIKADTWYKLENGKFVEVD